MRFNFKDKFLLIGIFYAFFVLVGIFVLAFIWLPPGYTLAGHDSGLPLDSKQFLLTRLYAWEDRLGFGLDNSANFGSLTIHFFDWFSSFIAGVPYAGNYVSVFFWMGLIFLSGFVFAYQLKDILGKPFVFILPVLLTFNFYIFQSVFMLERAKFGIFSATLISLAVFFRMQDKKLSLVTSAVISSLTFSIFNGGGWFGVTLYGGVVLILIVLLFVGFVKGVLNGSFTEFKRTLLFIILSAVFYIAFNAYSILPYLKNFLEVDAVRLFQDPSAENNKDWLRDISRSTSFLNLFRLLGVPDWYGGPDNIDRANPSHPYASFYLNNKALVAISFIFPLLASGGFLLAKAGRQKRTLCIFGIIALVEVIFTAGSQRPFGFFYEFLMDRVPGFFLFRSAFYKFGVFYFLGMSVLLAFTASFLIEKLTDLVNRRLTPAFPWAKTTLLFISTFLILVLWLAYHQTLFDPVKIFAWKADQTTKFQVPEYVFAFSKWTEKNKTYDKRVLLLPPPNKDWQNDAYNWGYWSLTPLPSTMSSARILSSWHALNREELDFVERIYDSVKNNNEESFLQLAGRLNVGHVLLRRDVLVDSSWAAGESPEAYRKVLESFKATNRVENFGEWELYRVELTTPNQIYAVSSVNLTPDNFISLANNFFVDGHTAGFSTRKSFIEIDKVGLNKIDVYDCLSCLLEKQARLKSLPETTILPNSLFFYFKARQEQELLAQTKDSKSKIGDYLGLVLRRTAELKTMVDLSVKEQYLLENMVAIRQYLRGLYSEIQVPYENAYDFELLKQALDFLNPVERELSDQVKGNVSKTRSHRFGEEALGILWDISRIKEFFTPLLGNIERWATEKVYSVGFSESGKHTLFFSSETFPRSLDGNVIFPERIKFIKNGEEKTLEITNNRGDWLSLDLGYQEKGEGNLILYFKELPNLFSTEGSGLENFPFGKAACYRGGIKNFDRRRSYQVLVSKTDRLRSVKIIFRDNNRVYSGQHGFLQGEDLFEVPAVAQGEFSRYIYTPSALARNITLYICSDDAILPLINEIIVREFFSPSVLTIRESGAGFLNPPDVSYAKINPTRYEGEIKDAHTPYILVFNEKINRSWKMFIESDGRWKVVDKHFMIDGYANSWLVNQIGTSKFKIEYTPQRLFYIGSAISITSLFAGLVWLVYSSIAAKKKGLK